MADFRAWAQRHGRQYTAAEEAHRYQTWSAAATLVSELNRGGANGAQFSLNGPWADLTPAEFRRTATSTVVSLSEQQLVSCDRLYAYGCNGGDPFYALVWILNRNRGVLAGTADFPYTSAVYMGTVPSDNDVMSYMARYGPISVAVAADQFQYYTSGVLDSDQCSNSESALNHAVVLVGYGTDSTTGKEYWMVRNSWGTLWGESGYIRVARGKNMCGINLMLSTIVA
eukprot:m51a1_g10515 hypothetical protein (227) ;mRNA; f:194513-195528